MATKHIVLNEISEEALQSVRGITELNNSQAVAAALKIADLVLRAQAEGKKIIFEAEHPIQNGVIERQVLHML